MDNQTETPLEEYVNIRIPAGAWALLLETLKTDAQSSNFDRSLRADIENALAQIENEGDHNLDHIFVFSASGSVRAVSDRWGNGFFKPNFQNGTVHLIDEDWSSDGICPVCHCELLEGDTCETCGYDTIGGTNESAIESFFKSLALKEAE